MSTICMWYALCDRAAVGTTSHLILGDVPICQRCADKHDLTVQQPFTPRVAKPVVAFKRRSANKHAQTNVQTRSEREDEPTSTWVCRDCGEICERYRGQSDVTCSCGAEYNASGQRLRDNWRDNPSLYDDEIGDLDGYEIAALRHESEG